MPSPCNHGHSPERLHGKLFCVRCGVAWPCLAICQQIQARMQSAHQPRQWQGGRPVALDDPDLYSDA